MYSKPAQLVRILAQASRSSFPHDQLMHHVKKAKSIVQEPKFDKDALRGELVRLEKKMQKMRSIERKLFSKETADVTHIEHQLRDMRLSLADSKQLKKRLDRILFLLGELAARADAHTHSKEMHEKRIAQIDEKVQSFINKKSVEAPEEQRQNKPLFENSNLRKQAFEEKYTTKPIPSPKLIFPEARPVRHRLLFPNSSEEKRMLPVPQTEPESTSSMSMEALPHEGATPDTAELPPVITVKKKPFLVPLQEKEKYFKKPSETPAPRREEKAAQRSPISTSEKTTELPSVITIRKEIPPQQLESTEKPNDGISTEEELVASDDIEQESEVISNDEELQPESVSESAPDWGLPSVITVRSDKTTSTGVPSFKPAAQPQKMPEARIPFEDIPSVITIKKNVHVPLSHMLRGSAFPSVITMKKEKVPEPYVSEQVLPLKEKLPGEKLLEKRIPPPPKFVKHRTKIERKKLKGLEIPAAPKLSKIKLNERKLLEKKIPPPPKFIKFKQPKVKEKKINVMEKKIPPPPTFKKFKQPEMREEKLRGLKKKIPAAPKPSLKVRPSKPLLKVPLKVIQNEAPKDSLKEHSLHAPPALVAKVSILQKLRKRYASLKKDAKLPKQKKPASTSVKGPKPKLVHSAHRLSLPPLVPIHRKHQKKIVPQSASKLSLWPFAVRRKKKEHIKHHLTFKLFAKKKGKQKRVKHHFRFKLFTKSKHVPSDAHIKTEVPIPVHPPLRNVPEPPHSSIDIEAELREMEAEIEPEEHFVSKKKKSI